MKVSGNIFERHCFPVAVMDRDWTKANGNSVFFLRLNLVLQVAKIIYGDSLLFSVFTDFLKARSGINDLCFSIFPVVLYVLYRYP